jgi:hypothetical protein
MHIRQMAENTSHLTQKGILASVPARDGHPGWLLSGQEGNGAVVGWHLGVTVKTLKSPIDGLEYTYLLADYEITEPYADEKIQRKTWRNRSSEIGGYRTNDEAEYWPVYMGFAFVDFPAVEGLNFSMSQGNKSYVIFDVNPLKENQMSTSSLPGGQPFLFGVPAQAPVAPVVPAAPATPFVFSAGGENVTDPIRVQNYITRLETFVSEQMVAGRKDFVASLVTTNRILASQKDGLEAFALQLNDEQYAAWQTTFTAPVAPQQLLGNHQTSSAVTANPDGKGQVFATENRQSDVDDAKAIVAMHRRMGTPTETLRTTPSFAKLVAAGVEK